MEGSDEHADHKQGLSEGGGTCACCCRRGYWQPHDDRHVETQTWEGRKHGMAV